MLRDAYPFILIALIIAVLFILGGIYLSPILYSGAILFVLLAAFVAYFFRNPERLSPGDPDLVLSPADGHVSLVRPLDAGDASKGTLVSIFLSVFDVHVNRTPIAGRITEVSYKTGKFMNAMDLRSSVENEQNIVTVENDRISITFKQIAGVIARRIVFWPKTGDKLGTGERIGLIKFGSRTDLLLPPEVEVQVAKGDRVLGGLTVIGRIRK